MNLYKDLEPGEKPPERINVVVEIPQGERNKYEYDERGYFRLDRTLHTPVVYEFEYGFIPRTRSKDGDSLDVILLMSRSTFPGCVVKARPIGVLEMEDEKGIDEKILAVPCADIEPRYADVKEYTDLSQHELEEIEFFMQDYKKLETGKWVKTRGWGNKKKAEEIIMDAIKRYEG